MYDYLIFDQLKRYGKANKSFHVPGHKSRGDFLKRFPVAPMDVTELSYSDNLFCPDGVIAAAQRDIAEILGAEKSFILTDGSTAGVLAMLYVLSGRGSKVIVARNCHQSVWNACRLFGLEPVIVQGEYREGVLLPPSPAAVEAFVKNDVSIAGMVVNNPDYYGNFAPLKEYSEILRKHKRLLVVDGAHGAHLAFEPEKRGYAGVYADLWVDGAHKSLPVLTQGAVVSARDKKLCAELEEALGFFRTTSPSYPIMASVEYGIKFAANNAELLNAAKSAAEGFKNSAGISVYPSDDWTKLAVDFKPRGISPDLAAKTLEKKGIYAEFSDGRYLLFYLSLAVTAKDLNGLLSALLSLKNDKTLKNTFKAREDIEPAERTYSFQYALKRAKELIPLESAEGRMCARNAGLTPPCIPVVAAGEIITKSAIKALKSQSGTFGTVNGRIWVVKK